MEHLAHGRYILVELAQDEKLSKGGILLTDGQPLADSKRSRVVSVSEELIREFSEKGSKYPIKVGDIIYHSFHSGFPMTTFDEKKLTALNIDNVLSVEISKK